jgi:hypothetical protein
LFVWQRFCQKKRLSAKAATTISTTVKVEKNKVEIVKLLNPKRAYGIDIGLARFRRSHQSIRDAIACMETSMGLEQLTQLRALVPTPDEIEAVTSYVTANSIESNVETLEGSAQFVFSLSTVLVG